MVQVNTLPSIFVVSSFHALADPIRLRVFKLLKDQEVCVCDLCEAIDITQSKLSFHLKVLKEAQLVKAKREGRWIYYSLNLSASVCCT